MLVRARQGGDTLLIAPTGGGKTLGGFLPSLVELAERGPTGRLHTLYVSPLKALTTDIARNLTRPVEEMGLPVRIETRTGDTPQNRRARQRSHPPDLLLTTPESLALLLSYDNAAEYFAGCAAWCWTSCMPWPRASAAPCSASPWRGCGGWRRRRGSSACRRRWRCRRDCNATSRRGPEEVTIVQGDPGAEPEWR